MHRKIRFTVEVGSKKVKILSVSNQSTGLIFDLKPAPYLRKNAFASKTDGPIDFRRITFHHSASSLTGNLITRTSQTGDNCGRYVQFTRALKTFDSFAEIMSRRFPDLSKGWPTSVGGCDDVCIDKFDPRKFNLILSVYVSKSGRELKYDDKFVIRGINIQHHYIGKYTIALLFSYYKLPSIDHGDTTFIFTTNPDKSNLENHISNECAMNGFNDYYVVERFFENEHLFRKTYLSLAGAWLPDRSASGT